MSFTPFVCDNLDNPSIKAHTTSFYFPRLFFVSPPLSCILITSNGLAQVFLLTLCFWYHLAAKLVGFWVVPFTRTEALIIKSELRLFPWSIIRPATSSESVQSSSVHRHPLNPTFGHLQSQQHKGHVRPISRNLVNGYNNCPGPSVNASIRIAGEFSVSSVSSVSLDSLLRQRQ